MLMRHVWFLFEMLRFVNVLEFPGSDHGNYGLCVPKDQDFLELLAFTIQNLPQAGS